MLWYPENSPWPLASFRMFLRRFEFSTPVNIRQCFRKGLKLCFNFVITTPILSKVVTCGSRFFFNEDLSDLCNTTHTKIPHPNHCGNAGNSYYLLMLPSMPLALFGFTLLFSVKDNLIPSCKSLQICRHKEAASYYALAFNPVEYISFFRSFLPTSFYVSFLRWKFRFILKKKCVFATLLITVPWLMTRHARCMVLLIPVQPCLLL